MMVLRQLTTKESPECWVIKKQKRNSSAHSRESIAEKRFAYRRVPSYRPCPASVYGHKTADLTITSAAAHAFFFLLVSFSFSLLVPERVYQCHWSDTYLEWRWNPKIYVSRCMQLLLRLRNKHTLMAKSISIKVSAKREVEAASMSKQSSFLPVFYYRSTAGFFAGALNGQRRRRKDK